MKKIFNIEIQLPAEPDFPAGNMLWLRTKAVNNLFHCNIKPHDFEDEMGQLDGTLAHSIEHSWFYIASANHYSALHHNYQNHSFFISYNAKPIRNKRSSYSFQE